MFDAYMGFDRIELEKLHKDLQKIFVKLGKKVDFHPKKYNSICRLKIKE